MSKYDELTREFKSIEADYNAGKTLTPAQVKRLDEIAAELPAAAEEKSTQDRGAGILRALGGAGQKSELRVDGHEAGYLTTAAVKSSAAQTAKAISAEAGLETKALTVGNFTAPVRVAGVAPFGQAVGFLESVRTVLFPDRFISYLRQTSRTNSAAVVVEGALKPESVYGLERKQDEARVIAHVSEPIDEYLAADVEAVGELVAHEMMYGLYRTVEDQVLNGSGVAPNATGILNTAGIQTVTTGTNELTRLRAAITNLHVQGLLPTRIVLHPSDWAAIETLTATGGEFLFHAERGPVNTAEFRLWGVPVALSVGIPVGTALVMDDLQMYVAAGGPVSVKVGQPGDMFQRNQIQFRVEGRFVPVVVQPLGMVKVTLRDA